MVFEQRDVLSDTIYTLRHEFLVRRRDGAHHVLHVGVVEHSAVHDAAARDVVERIARHLAVAYHDVVASACCSRHSELAQHFDNHTYVFAECQRYVLAPRDVREHYVALVGIYAASTAFSAECVYVMCAAVFQVYFALNELITSKYNGRGDLPHKEIIVAFHVSCNVFLHCKIVCQSLFFRGSR